MEVLLILIAALLGLLVLVGGAGLVLFVEHSRRRMAALRRIEVHAETDSNETFPAIRAALDDVVNVLLPPQIGGR